MELLSGHARNASKQQTISAAPRPCRLHIAKAAPTRWEVTAVCRAGNLVRTVAFALRPAGRTWQATEMTIF
jgi:rhodanese-related sulfurtransferase